LILNSKQPADIKQ